MPEPRYWLMKSEPDVYSIDDLQKAGTGTWEGVRNYMARNHMRAMQKGDRALFYHSSTEPPGVAGLMKITRTAYPDETQFDPKSDYYDAKSPRSAPRWDRVDVTFEKKFTHYVPLEALRLEPALADMLVIRRGMRLSVQPVTQAEFERIVELGSSARKSAPTKPSAPKRKTPAPKGTSVGKPRGAAKKPKGATSKK